MIRFFRLLRRKFLEEGHIRKYFWYALGEILLVMIGILLALQVNNWNAERKQNAAIQSYLIQIQNELMEDLFESFQLSKDLEAKDDMLTKILLNQVTAEDYKTNFTLRMLVTGNRSMEFNSEGYTSLMGMIDEANFENQELLRQLKVVYVDRKASVLQASGYLDNEVTEYRQHITRTYDWVKDYDPLIPGISDEEIEYYLSSAEYLNHVVSYRFLGTLNLRSFLYLFQFDAITLYKLMAEQTGYDTDNELVMSYEVSKAGEEELKLQGIYQLKEGQNSMGATDQIRLYVRNDTLKMDIQQFGEFNVIKGYPPRIHLEGTPFQFVFDNDSTLRALDHARTQYIKVD